jgi:choloylglycine hydrolase
MIFYPLYLTTSVVYDRVKIKKKENRMCTGVRLRAENGACVYGRTLEFGKEMESNIIMVPKDFPFTATGNNKSDGISWQAKYAALGANALNLMHLLDGVNEKGLAGGLFYFPGYAEYQKVDDENIKNSLAPWELLTWILTTCEDVDAVKKAVPKIYVSSAILREWGIVPPIHVIVHDQAGKSLVIEYINGNLVMKDNPLGVFTNAPTFEWHLTNLTNYAALSPFNVSTVEWSGIALTPPGQGSGMLGLPGDFTPTSRFVRAAAFSAAVTDIETEAEARDAVFHILNLFDIPRGIIREQQETERYADYTQWTSVVDLKNKRYYWRTYTNHQIHFVDLMQMDTQASHVVVLPMKQEQQFVNQTP